MEVGKKLHIILGLALVLCSSWAKAQEVQYAQFYNDPYQLNPALAGASKYNRIGLHYRNQWPGIKNNYKTYSAYVDKRLAGINSGIGLYVLEDVAGDGALQYDYIAGSYAYGLRVNYNQMIRFGLRTALAMRSINFNKLVFTDQFVRDNAPSTIEGFDNNQVSYLDFSFGIEYKLNKQNLRFGFAADHLTRPNQSFTNTKNHLPIRYSAYVLYDMVIKGNTSQKSSSYVSYAALYKAQLSWDQLDFGAIYHYDAMEFGLFYRGIPGLKAYKPGYANNEAFIGYIGFQWLNIHFGYNYDFSMSKLGNIQSHGAHEITMIFAYGFNPKRKKPKSIPCSDIVGTSMVKKARF
ncbi:PorP/SprF family type IX secretion system membrane protein [Luteibaculum oceani]|uniref:Type IX secretion system membrane protein PorP/SprF n=1 Tax=Luteibaculum oceani TaxID=1294296 RepID=A0A5C6USK2_9FLAO|nr:PorP/SprF family type IX secretion system membrane protein [Luteibaculum oceani]TXC76227.1 type IX secretion system membrane protein PorP/SprF [Luteibaculum oceani]